jgi:hypothetical protein
MAVRRDSEAGSSYPVEEVTMTQVSSGDCLGMVADPNPRQSRRNKKRIRALYHILRFTGIVSSSGCEGLGNRRDRWYSDNSAELPMGTIRCRHIHQPGTCLHMFEAGADAFIVIQTQTVEQTTQLNDLLDAKGRPFSIAMVRAPKAPDTVKVTVLKGDANG